MNDRGVDLDLVRQLVMSLAEKNDIDVRAHHRVETITIAIDRGPISIETIEEIVIIVIVQNNNALAVTIEPALAKATSSCKQWPNCSAYRSVNCVQSKAVAQQRQTRDAVTHVVKLVTCRARVRAANDK